LVRALALRRGVTLEAVPSLAVEHRASASAVVIARDEAAHDAERGERDVEHVVGGVDRDQTEDVLSVDKPDDGHQAVDQTEPECDGASGGAPGRGGEQNDSRCDMDQVMNGVDLEGEEQVALDAVTGIEARIRDEAEDAGEE
jgi:hypothetical protein